MRHRLHLPSLIMGMTGTPAFKARLAEKGLPLPDGGLGEGDAMRGVTSVKERRVRIIGVNEMSVQLSGQ